jgi:hypothetical protein
LPASDSKIEEGARVGRSRMPDRQASAGGTDSSLLYVRSFVRSFVLPCLLKVEKNCLSFSSLSFFHPPAHTSGMYSTRQDTVDTGYSILDHHHHLSVIIHL